MTNEEIEKKISQLVLERKTIDDKLKNLRETLSKNRLDNDNGKAKNLIDKIFSTVSEKTNTVLLASCYGEYGQCYSGYGGDYDNEYPENKISLCEKYNEWCVTEGSISNETYKAIKDFCDYIEEINFNNKIAPYVCDIYDCEEVNEYWSGYVALTRDYKIVTFVCRDDDMMEDATEKQPKVYYVFK